MNEWERLHKQAKQYKEMYPPGTRLELISMDDPYAPVPPGTRGTVQYVDDAAQIGMIWDDGRTLSLIPGEDSFRKLTEEELKVEQMQKLPHINGKLTAFCIDTEKSFQGYSAAHGWNGWECPLFPKSSADEIQQYYNNEYLSIKYDEKTDCYITEYLHENCSEEYEGQDYVVNGKIEHLYAIGSHEWCWDTAEQEETQNMDKDKFPIKGM